MAEFHFFNQKIAEYGLTEIKKEGIRVARLVANPGCYPTSFQLPLIPLFKAGLLEVENIIIDAKSSLAEQIDNLMKGASGQALQNFNVMFGFPEETGLLYQPLFP